MKRRVPMTTFYWAVFAVAAVGLFCLIVAFCCPPVDAAEPEPPIEQIAEPTVLAEEPAEEPAFTAEELNLLALVIYQEAGGDSCSDQTRRMVGEVALNRVADDRYPDTLEGVLTQRSQYGRLHWTGLVWPERANHPGEAHAVLRAYECATAVLMNEERLLPKDVVFQAEFWQGSEIVAYSDGFYFCR